MLFCNTLELKPPRFKSTLIISPIIIEICIRIMEVCLKHKFLVSQLLQFIFCSSFCDSHSFFFT